LWARGKKSSTVYVKIATPQQSGTWLAILLTQKEAKIQEEG
jgi:hypothetical protein